MIAELQNAVPLSHAARQWFPKSRTGKPIHTSVLSRWSDSGVRRSDGVRIYLETRRVGGQRLVTEEAVEAFLTALNAGSATVSQQTEDETARRSREAGAALEKLGC